MTPDSELTDALDRTSTPCVDCTANVRWETRDVSATAEAWLGTCDLCGSMQVLALGATELEIEDPLAYFLLGVPRFDPPTGRPAWQRFYARTLDPPFNLRWSFEVDPCEACEARSSVGTTLFTPRGRRSLTVCLNCGFTCVETTGVAPTASRRLTGGQWSRPCPAVRTLRESVFEPYRQWASSDDWRRRMADEE